MSGWFDQAAFDRWLAERCEAVPGEWVEAGVLYADHCAWARQKRAFVPAQRSFSLALQRVEWLRKQLHSRSRRSGFAGVRLRGSDGGCEGIWGTAKDTQV